MFWHRPRSCLTGLDGRRDGSGSTHPAARTKINVLHPLRPQRQSSAAGLLVRIPPSPGSDRGSDLIFDT